MEPELDLKDPRHQQLYDYWLGKKAGRRAPKRSDIDPVDLIKLLPNLFIFKVLDNGGRDYLLTLLGTDLVNVMGHDFTGSTFDEMYRGDSARILREHYDYVTDNCQPCYACMDASWMSKEFITYERLLLPLSEDGARVDKLLGCSFFVKKGRS